MQILKIRMVLRIMVIKQFDLITCWLFNQPRILHARDFSWLIHVVLQISASGLSVPWLWVHMAAQPCCPPPFQSLCCIVLSQTVPVCLSVCLPSNQSGYFPFLFLAGSVSSGTVWLMVDVPGVLVGWMYEVDPPPLNSKLQWKKGVGLFCSMPGWYPQCRCGSSISICWINKLSWILRTEWETKKRSLDLWKSLNQWTRLEVAH